jgi:hypothetical protein
MLKQLASNPQVMAAFQKLLTDGVEIVAALLGLVLMKAATAVKNSNLNIVQKMVAERLVSYAEQTITTADSDKAAYVAAQLKAKFPSLNEEEVAHLLEAAVLQVKNTVAQPQTISVATTEKGDVNVQK